MPCQHDEHDLRVFRLTVTPGVSVVNMPCQHDEHEL